MQTAAPLPPRPSRDTQQVEVEPGLLLGPRWGSMGASGSSTLTQPRLELEGRLGALLWKREQRDRDTGEGR